MKALAMAGALALLATPVIAAGNGGPDTPTFAQFVATCRVGNTIEPHCKTGVVQIYADEHHLKMDAVACDDKAFWKEVDAHYSDSITAVAPWMYGVGSVADQPHVCGKR